MANGRKAAIVTGASRGIGRACALALARRGLDVVVCARTLRKGMAFEYSATARESAVSEMPGTLEETAAEAEKLGVRALPVKMDLLERKEIEDGVQLALDSFGKIDVLVNNGRYYGPGQMDIFEETDIQYFDKAVEANLLAPLYLIKLIIPSMIKSGGGVIVDLTSSSGSKEVPNPVGQGGWGLNYSVSKAGINRAGAGLAKELRPHNIAVINMSPGYVAVERGWKEAGRYGFNPETGLNPDIPGAACAFLATHKYPMFFSGRDWQAVDVCVEHGLIDPDTLPAGQGPATWGLPRPGG